MFIETMTTLIILLLLYLMWSNIRNTSEYGNRSTDAKGVGPFSVSLFLTGIAVIALLEIWT